jgi:hypothetical protein
MKSYMEPSLSPAERAELLLGLKNLDNFDIVEYILECGIPVVYVGKAMKTAHG